VKSEEFLDNLGTLAAAAGGTKRLREMVLDLAVRGDLVGQMTTDGSAEELLTILAKAKRAIATGRGVESLPDDVEPVDPPFPLPPAWRWARLADLGMFVGGGTPSKSNSAYWTGKIPWVSPKDMKRPYIGDAEDHISDAALEDSAAKLIPSGALLFVTRGMILAHSFPTALTTREVTINQDMKALVLFVPAMGEYLLRACQAARRRMLQQVERSSHGTCRLDTTDVANLPIPLPPLKEQKRIVAKVDQLMALCDDLEAKQTKKRALATQSTRSALTALAMADTVTDLKETWARVASNFNGLAAAPDAVNAFREAALSLGLGGWLGDIASRSRTNGEELRAGWWRGDLGDAAEFVTSGSRNWKNFHSESGSIFIRSQDIRSDALDLTSPAFVSLPGKAEGMRTRVKLNDVLVTITGANVGKAAYVTHDVGEAYVSQHVALIRLRDPSLAPWVHRWLVCQSKGRGQLLGASYGDKPGLNLENIRSVPLEVPPTGEREMLLARMGVLLAVCDDLEAKLRKQEQTATRLAESLAAAVAA
jgi:type I restriction enzyme S subunit